MLFGFTLYQIAAYFLIYSFLGWCVEVAYAAVTRGKLVNREIGRASCRERV